MHDISPDQRQKIAGGASACLCSERVPAQTDMPLPLFSSPAYARIFSDTVTARELWPA